MYRFLVISAAVLMLGGTLASDAFAAGDFHKSCINMFLEYDTDGKNPALIGDCRKRDGSMRTAGIDLNSLIANDDGNLVWRISGAFGNSCRSIILNAPVLGAICTRRDGSETPFAVINLAERIANIDGHLKYVEP